MFLERSESSGDYVWLAWLTLLGTAVSGCSRHCVLMRSRAQVHAAELAPGVCACELTGWRGWLARRR